MRSPRIAPVSAALLVASALAACSLFVDTDGLSTKGDLDAGTMADSPIDAISDHAIPVIDAGVDANVDASATPFCQANPGHSLCLDFDESTDLPAFDTSNFDPGAMFIDPSGGVSQPNSLSITYPASGGTEQITKNFSETMNGKLFISLDIKLASSDLTKGQVQPLALFLPSQSGIMSHYYYLQGYFGTFDYSEAVTPSDGGASSYPSVALASPIPNDTWMHIEMTVDDSTRTKTVTLNGNVVSTASAALSWPIGNADFSLGGFSSGLPAQTVVHIDNVIVDY